MKVLVITAAFPPMRAGEADQALHFARHLADRGVEVHVLTTRGHLALPSFPFKVHPIMRDWSWWDLGRLARFLRWCNPDAVLLMYIGWIYHGHPMITFAPTISKLLRPRAVFVTQFANVTGALRKQRSFPTRFFRLGLKQLTGKPGVSYEYGTLLRDSDRVIVLSDHHRAVLAELSPVIGGKSVLIPPPPIMAMAPPDEEARRDTRTALGLGPAEFLLAYLGYIYEGKGIETLLKAFQIVSGRRGQVRLILVGGTLARADPDRPSYGQDLLELADRLGIADRISWTGEYRWDSQDGSRYLRAADAFVLSMDVGVQLNNSSFAAAVAHGLPVVATRSSRLEAPFVDRENVLLCPPRDPEMMAAAIEALLDDPALRERLSVGSRRFAEEWFSWTRAIDRVMETVTGGPSPSPPRHQPS
ncbi:MAG TPA: glycosyltransferase family 4 protein [Gemmatimonadales bacterium]|jgi:glycosyltransferase involved in cell wall biosynthesis|nr:glycosyltransferase family 4 protein [Gemmatimonadales bacterium]